MNKVIPKKIYLQFDPEGDKPKDGYYDSDEVTWCEDRINKGDVEYALSSNLNEEKIASLKNRLSPFWNLFQLMLLEKEDLPSDPDKYAKLMEREAIKCKKNQNEIIALLNSIV